ncbi:MAG: bile acid:sodium symporter family protein [Sedimentisphaerales bacterium]|nr:bile acid:sodium symporter family protein [Sedimentisphaerales bacterium]
MTYTLALMWRNALAFYTRSFALWVVLFGVVAYLWPAPFLALDKHKTLFFSLTMFGIGAVLRVEDFQRILESPVIVLIGSAAQFTIMPLGAFLVARWLKLPDALAVGLILTGSAPGAMASNVMSYIAKADTAYSVSLTTVSTLLCPVLTPGLTYLLTQGTSLNVSFWAMVLDVMIMVVIPLVAGFAVRHYFREKLERIEPIFPALSSTFIIFICSLIIALNRSRLADVTGLVLAAVLLLNVYGLAAGYGVGSLFRLGTKRRRTLTIEIGMQNAGLGATLALKNLTPETALPAALFVFVCILTASALTSLWHRTSA